jgi:hypothetical protein
MKWLQKAILPAILGGLLYSSSPTKASSPEAFSECKKLDIAFIIDVSGSMSEEINTMKSIANNLYSKLSNTVDLNSGVNIYGLPFNEPKYLRLKKIDSDKNSFSRALESVSLTSGGSEYAAITLDNVARFDNWRDDSYKLAIFLTDEPDENRQSVSEVSSYTGIDTLAIINDKENTETYFYWKNQGAVVRYLEGDFLETRIYEAIRTKCGSKPNYSMK